MTPSNHPRLDLDFVRSCFPAFAQTLPANTAFFENAGGSYVAGAVLNELMRFYREHKVQPYGASQICRVAGERMDAGRATMADLLGVHADTITLGPSTTQNINTLALACATLVDADSRVIVSAQDHEANIGAWQRLCRRSGAELAIWAVDPQSGELSLDALRRMMDARTKIVCVTHSSNIVGTINPIEEVIALCRQNGARAVVDGVSYAPHQWPNLRALRPDAYCFSTYKTYATHLGVLYTAPEFAAALDPQCHYFNRDCAHKRLDSAGPDHASIAALAGLGEYFAASHAHHFRDDDANQDSANRNLAEQAQAVSALMHRHESELCAPLLEALRALPLRVIGRADMRGREANIALVSERHSSAHLSAALAARGIAAGHGHFYAKRLLENIGLRDSEDGVLRISFAHYNSEAEVERVIDALRALH
ncbi:MAG: aminotransferase class V-fold PLP-dependent enzyme [bacterium]